MAWSRRRKWFALILAVLVLVAIAAIQLQPVNPMRNAYKEIREGMNVVQVAEALKRCGWNKYFNQEAWGAGTGMGPVADAYESLFFYSASGMEAASGRDMRNLLRRSTIFKRGDGETLTDPLGGGLGGLGNRATALR